MGEQSIEDRLHRVEFRAERLERRLKLTTLAWVLSVLILFVAARTGVPRSAEQHERQMGVVRIRQLLVVDRSGINRIVIGPIPDPQIRGSRMKRRSPATGVEVNDASGNERVGLAILDDGSTVVGMDDEAGQERAHLYYVPKKGAGVLLHGEKEKETISLSIPPERESTTPKIKITDPAGRIIFALPNSK